MNLSEAMSYFLSHSLSLTKPQVLTVSSDADLNNLQLCLLHPCH